MRARRLWRATTYSARWRKGLRSFINVRKLPPTGLKADFTTRVNAFEASLVLLREMARLDEVKPATEAGGVSAV